MIIVFKYILYLITIIFTIIVLRAKDKSLIYVCGIFAFIDSIFCSFICLVNANYFLHIPFVIRPIFSVLFLINAIVNVVIIIKTSRKIK